MYGLISNDPFARLAQETTQSGRDYMRFTGQEPFNTLGFNDGANVVGIAGTAEQEMQKLEQRLEKQEKDSDEGWDLYNEAVQRTKDRLSEIDQMNDRLRAAGLDMTIDDINALDDALNDPDKRDALKDKLMKDNGWSEYYTLYVMALMEERNNIARRIADGTATVDDRKRLKDIDDGPDGDNVKASQADTLDFVKTDAAPDSARSSGETLDQNSNIEVAGRENVFDSTATATPMFGPG